MEIKTHLEHDLPTFLQESIEVMKKAWERLDKGEKYLQKHEQKLALFQKNNL